MTRFVLDQELPHYDVTAHNFAEASENKIHSDAVAEDYGYRGGLVPGVAMYAYMTVPVAKTLERAWLAHGTMSAKFIHPVYDEEGVTVTGKVTGVDPTYVSLRLTNDQGQLCAVGSATLPGKRPSVDISRYPYRPLPEERLEPKLDALKEDTPLGSLHIPLGESMHLGEYGDVREELRDPLAIYREDPPTPHPALWVMKANRLLMENVALGPWIHTASDVQHHNIPEPDEDVYMHGRVAHSYMKRGHEIVVLDLVVLGRLERPLVHLTHTAIVKPAKTKPGTLS